MMKPTMVFKVVMRRVGVWDLVLVLWVMVYVMALQEGLWMVR